MPRYAFTCHVTCVRVCMCACMYVRVHLRQHLRPTFGVHDSSHPTFDAGLLVVTQRDGRADRKVLLLHPGVDWRDDESVLVARSPIGRVRTARTGTRACGRL